MIDCSCLLARLLGWLCKWASGVDRADMLCLECSVVRGQCQQTESRASGSRAGHAEGSGCIELAVHSSQAVSNSRRAGGGCVAAAATESMSAQAIQIEELPREVGELTEQQRAAIVADAPELEALLHELKDGLEEIRTRLAPLLKEVRGTAARPASDLLQPFSVAKALVRYWTGVHRLSDS